MNVKHCLLFLLFSYFTIATAAAQSDSLKVYRNEIGADFRPVITNGGSAGVLYRRHQPNAAWRVRVTGSFSSGNLLGGWERVDVLATNWRWGREWHLPYKKFRFYYGLDLLTGYHYNRHRFSPEPNQQRSYALTGGLLPLIGCTYVLDERFSVSVETNGSYTATMTFANGNPYSRGHGDFISGYAIFLSYRF